tara:strand:+ start:339 stop:512 length:174 start_codon:yes stop_codon:yes gene_type:complete
LPNQPPDCIRATGLRNLEGSSWAREALGEDFLKVFLAIKWAEYRQFMGEANRTGAGT